MFTYFSSIIIIHTKPINKAVDVTLSTDSGGAKASRTGISVTAGHSYRGRYVMTITMHSGTAGPSSTAFNG